MIATGLFVEADDEGRHLFRGVKLASELECSFLGGKVTHSHAIKCAAGRIVFHNARSRVRSESCIFNFSAFASTRKAPTCTPK